jgi:hypothetical protein
MKMNDLDELHHFVNDIYERWDEGEIEYLQARNEARVYYSKWAFMDDEALREKNDSPFVREEDLSEIFDNEEDRLLFQRRNKKYTESVKGISAKFNINEDEFYERNTASIFNNKYDSPNFVVSYGDRDSYTEVLYFDGDDGRAIISNNCEIFEEEGCQIKLHECNYCDFEWETIQDIFNILQEVEEYADE